MIRLGKNTSTYTFSPDNPPAIKVDPGTTIVFETLDALNEQIKSDEDSASAIDLDHVNAATGPVYINGAKSGDTIVAEILDLIPQYSIPRPRIETVDELMCVASAEGLDNAIRLALQDMLDWLRNEKHLTQEEAYVLVSIAGDVRIGQIVDPAVTVRVAMPKEIFI